jgi:hypothetical protein
MAMPDAVRGIQVLFAICVQVQGLPCPAAALRMYSSVIRWQEVAESILQIIEAG